MHGFILNVSLLSEETRLKGDSVYDAVKAGCWERRESSGVRGLGNGGRDDAKDWRKFSRRELSASRM